MKKKKFFHNFLTIMMFGVIGVFISVAIIVAGSHKSECIESLFSWFDGTNMLCFYAHVGSWELFPKLGFSGLSTRDYLGEIC